MTGRLLLSEEPLLHRCHAAVDEQQAGVVLRDEREAVPVSYTHLSFNLKLLDGALIQLQYKFKGNSLTGHRLGFFPNPDLTSFQENPEMCIRDSFNTQSILTK